MRVFSTRAVKKRGACVHGYMNTSRIQELRRRLLEEHRRVWWGCLLVFSRDFFNFLPDGSVVLDVGCNVQMLKHGILERRPSCFVVGLDIVDYSVLYEDPGGKRPDIIASGEALPLREGCVDFLSMIETLEHMDSAAALREARRVLKAGGRLFIQSVHKDDPAFKADPTHVTPLDEGFLRSHLQGMSWVEVRRISGTLVVRAVK